MVKMSSTTEQKPKALSSPPPKKTKKDYDKKYDLSKRTRTFQETWLTDFQWLPVDDNQIATSSGAEPQSDEVDILD